MDNEIIVQSKEELIVRLLEKGIYKVQQKQLYECSRTELFYYYLSITRDSLKVLTSRIN